ncbi:glycosyltransferase family 4 protein [Micromonospora okii]|uniref:glycosyltransferase family 4 protein n=1 Tax=Micromonospora okii TaxID=1182970 RepID=UPI001E3A3577|nr:glycosyltransferase [Micromonospora okii]
MRVVVTTESRYVRTPDGGVWTRGAPDYRIWQRYLSAFDEVRVVARVADVADVPAGALRVDGDAVRVHALPYYVGPAQYLRQRARIGRAVARAAGPGDAVILRVPSALGSLLAAERRRRGLPYALEVVGDPYDVFAPGVVRHPLRPLLRRRFTDRLRRECAAATAVAYVTESYLQRRYPHRGDAPAAALSSVDLPGDAFVARPRPAARCAGARGDLVAVGTLDQLYKGFDTLIAAVARLAAAGVQVRLTHVGAGRYDDHLRRLADQLGVGHRVDFVGQVPPGAPLHAHLDAADLFVMPSRTEGLPRALVEAMARALPAIGTAVGGIPELLATDDLVAPDDPDGLAVAVREMLADPARMAGASARNLDRATAFARPALEPRRADFYRTVRARCQPTPGDAPGRRGTTDRLPAARRPNGG